MINHETNVSLDKTILEKLAIGRKISTANTYFSRIRTVFVKGLGESTVPETHEIILTKLNDNRDFIIKWIREKFGVNLQTVTLRALLVLLGIIKETGLDCEQCEQFYRGYYQATQRQDQETQVYREPTEKQLEKGITFQDVIDKFEQEKGLLDTWNGYLSFARFRRVFILACRLKYTYHHHHLEGKIYSI